MMVVIIILMQYVMEDAKKNVMEVVIEVLIESFKMVNVIQDL